MNWPTLPKGRCSAADFEVVQRNFGKRNLNMAIALRLVRSGRSIGYLSLLGFLFVLFTMGMIVKTAFDAYQESKHAKWPTVVATITQQTVRKIPAGSRGEWYIESTLRYNVGGEDLTSSTHSGGGAFWEEFSMRRWASQHPPGTTLPIRYDPQKHSVIIPNAGDMPESGPQVPDDLKAILLFSILSMAFITIGRLLDRKQENSV